MRLVAKPSNALRPVGVPASYGDHAKLMFDLQALALQGDITRVITFQLARETSNRSYPEIGVADPHHPTSHHGGDPEKIAKIAKIKAFTSRSRRIGDDPSTASRTPLGTAPAEDPRSLVGAQDRHVVSADCC